MFNCTFQRPLYSQEFSQCARICVNKKEFLALYFVIWLNNFRNSLCFTTICIIVHGTANNVRASMMCYACESTRVASSKCKDTLLSELERMSNQMLAYCKLVGPVISSDKTQMLVLGVKDSNFHVPVGGSLVCPSKELNLLGITYDSNFNTIP